MKITGPTIQDLEAILMELDDDYDGVVSKDEFFGMIKLVLKSMLKSEEEILSKYNK